MDQKYYSKLSVWGTDKSRRNRESVVLQLADEDVFAIHVKDRVLETK